MITVFLRREYASDEEAVSRVKKLIDRETMYNPNLNGANIKVDFCDFTHIRGADEIVGIKLLGKVFNCLHHEEYSE